MRLLYTVLQTLLLSGSTYSACNKADTTVDEASEFSLIYGFPLLAYSNLVIPAFETGVGSNTFIKRTNLSGSDDKDVVRPNTDTLYAASLVDLALNDVIVTAPSITDRYWDLAFYDVYGNNYANVGTIKKTPSGKYHIRYAVEANEQPGLQLCDGDCADCKGFINSPTIYGYILTRILVRDNGTDLSKVHDLEDQFCIFPVARNCPHKRPAPPLSPDMFYASLSNDTATKIMQMTARIAPNNPARNISDQSRVDAMLDKAGIRNGVYTPPAGTDLAKADEQAKKAVAAHATKPENFVQVGNGWSSLVPSAQGDYYTDYKMRAFVANEGYLALVATEAVYPTHREPNGDLSLNVGPREAYLVTFVDDKPPLAPLGFWSMTTYTADQFLVPNSINQYSLGDRSNLTYPDGEPLYGGTTQKRAFQILVQPADAAPPSNWTSNWLPAPAGGGDFSLTFRIYGPTKAITNGSYTFPLLEKRSAITNS
ncbi:hypothetical protein CDD81_5352 [Ophiocordyceps australis]|uniref:DUF1254 domain-containing protein n=1 Tax=Ophiocordyceps australis TaxID=1399860 RepID=A0A2C5YAC4_9HYPO|nr:hypothetical protein CDD81_5352 [Ophiocordyceps australis]